jgi:hypothetical protein
MEVEFDGNERHTAATWLRVAGEGGTHGGHEAAHG